MAWSCQSSQELLPALTSLQKSVQEAAEEGVSFRKHNTRFDKRNETTQLLNAAAEQLWNEKQAMEQANFEEHSSDLPYLCQHFRTTVSQGLSESSYAEKSSQLQLKRRSAGHQVEPKPRRCCGGCSSEFPPQQGWWSDITQQLVPKYQVLRSGKLALTPATELVPGDIMYISAGQQAVVDGRILVISDTSTTAVDVSHLTGRSNDIRICSSRHTGVSPIESRNIILKDSHIISGTLFCMVVRSPLEPFVSSSASSGLLDCESLIDTAVPVTVSLSTCQNVFKNLCVKAHLFCKSFKIMDCIRSTRTIVVMLTQALIEKGNIPSFCSTMQKLKKSIIFVNCNCNDGSIDEFCKKLGAKCTNFEDPDMMSSQRSHEKLEGVSEIDESVVDLGFLSAAGMEMVGEFESSKLTSFQAQLIAAGDASIDVIKGISQAALLKLCRSLGDADNPLLYIMTEFHYPKCFRSLAVEGNRYTRLSPSVMGSMSLIGAANGSSPYGATPSAGHNATPNSRHNVSKIGFSTSMQDVEAGKGGKSSQSLAGSKYGSEGDYSTASKGTTGFTSMVSTQTDPAPHINVGGQQGAVGSCQVSSGVVKQIFVAVDSIGIVSAHSDCILLKPDLGAMGVGLELISKKLGR